MAAENHINSVSPKTSEEKPLSNVPCGKTTKSMDVNLSQRMKKKLSGYVLSLRPWSFSASLAPTALGAALAYKCSDQFSFALFIVTCLTVLSVHAAGNVVNTYFDFMKGIDNTRSDDRTLVDRILTPDEISHLGVLLYVIGCLGFISLVMLSPAKMEHLALVYFGGLSSSFLYTGGIGLKYIALGDVLILVTFGPVAVLFSFMSQTGYMDLITLFYAMPLALNTEAILHSNNTRDITSDSRAGLLTIAILIGHTGSHILYALLLFVPYIIFTVMGLHFSKWWLLPLITLPKAFDLEKKFRDGCLQILPKQTAKLNIYFGLFYIIACLMADPTMLPRMKIGLL